MKIKHDHTDCETCIRICKNENGIAPSISEKRHLWTKSQIVAMIGMMEEIKASLISQSWDLTEKKIKNKNESK